MDDFKGQENDSRCYWANTGLPFVLEVLTQQQTEWLWVAAAGAAEG